MKCIPNVRIKYTNFGMPYFRVEHYSIRNRWNGILFFRILFDHETSYDAFFTLGDVSQNDVSEQVMFITKTMIFFF